MNIFEFAIARKFAMLSQTEDPLAPADFRLMITLEPLVQQYKARELEER